jgi:hypothetical protein
MLLIGVSKARNCIVVNEPDESRRRLTDQHLDWRRCKQDCRSEAPLGGKTGKINKADAWHSGAQAES